jgi:two-component system alkaline phosphatase synthesis response regulator PhoP
MESKRVMIVDDEENFVKVVKMNLEETGRFEVRALLNAKELIPNLYGFKPDVILLDLIMPGIGGIEACELLNNDPVGQGVPIIILTALEKEMDKVAAYKKGVVDYLVKPIEKDNLIARIDKVLQAKS